MDSEQSRSRRPGRWRTAQSAAEIAPQIPSAHYRHLRNPFEPLRVLSEDEVGAAPVS